MSERPSVVVTVTLNPAIDKVLVAPGFGVGEHIRAEVKSVTAAGKGINVARGVARMGGRVGACALIGRDEHRVFHQSLHRETIDARLILVDGRTRVNTTILDPEARTTTHVREPGFEVQPDDLAAVCRELADWLPKLAGAPVVVFAGSLPPNMMADDFAAVVEAVAQTGCPIVVDTNGLALRAALETGVVATVKPNLSELSECLGREIAPQDVLEAGCSILSKATTVLVTMGADGAWVLTGGQRVGWRCRLDPSELQNTVGCGDAFLAGWLLARMRGADISEALHWAVAAGAAGASSETSVGYTLADVEALLPRCERLDG